jgi:flavorubredoxin
MLNETQQAVYDRPIEIAEGVYWVGFADTASGLHCNPYCIIDGDEAVIIDGGSRPDFPTVMLKILQAGVSPSCIKALIYQHYDPDLCGSIPNFEDIISRKDLTIISDQESNVFIRHYYVSSRLLSTQALGNRFTFSSGRTLSFYQTPYCHSLGSFVTLDSRTKILFTSDLFGSISRQWELFLEFSPACRCCIAPMTPCPATGGNCPVKDILVFHSKIMTSNRALRNALRIIAAIHFQCIAPQHGSILRNEEDIRSLIKRLSELENVGVDGIQEACTEACTPKEIMHTLRMRGDYGTA